MKAYRKRAKGSWCAGKGCKGDGAERQYSKREIQEQLVQDEEDYLERYHKGKRTRNTRARLEYRVRWYEGVIEQWARMKHSGSMDSYFRSSLARAKKELAEAIEKEKKL